MGTFLKQPQRARTTRKDKNDTPVDRATKYAGSHFGHSSCVEQALDGLTSVLSTYVKQALNGDNGSGLYSEASGHPVKVALAFQDDEGRGIGIYMHSEALDSIAESFARIADAMTTDRTSV